MKLLVIIPDRLSDIVTKGEMQPGYYNPGDLFDEVHILMTNDDRPDPEALQRMAGRARLFLHNHPDDLNLVGRKPGFLAPLRLRRWARGGVEIARRIAPDMIRCHGADWNVYLASRIKAVLGVPYVVSLHINPDVNPVRRYLDPANEAERLHNRFYDHIERRGLRDADWVLPVYKPILPYLERLDVKRVEVCYNVLNRKHLGVKTDYRLHDPVRILYVGRLIAEKNPANIIRALAGIPDARYTIVGDGPIRPDLEKLCLELGLSDRVRFEPSVDNDALCRELPDYDLFAIHTEYFEISKSLLEALLTGLPVILNQRLGEPVPELQEGFVRLVENTPEAYGATIRQLIEDDGARAEIGRKAFDHARKRWDPAVTEAAYVRIYREVMGIDTGTSQ